MKAIVFARDRGHRSVVRIVLEQEGFEVIEAATVKDAVLGAWTEHPKLIMVSLDEAAMSLEFARGIRASRSFDDVRVIAYSVDGSSYSHAKVLAAGFDRYAMGLNAVSSVRSAIRSLALQR
ncbi:MAG: PleD family two-component system response regulator [Actinomycetota bacterium]